MFSIYLLNQGVEVLRFATLVFNSKEQSFTLCLFVCIVLYCVVYFV